MNCQDIEERLPDYLLGEVSVGERDAIRAHLVGCRVCAAEEAALRRSITHVEGALRSDRRAPDDFLERVMRHVGAGTSVGLLSATVPVKRWFPMTWRLRGWAVAVAVALLGAMVVRFGGVWPHPAPNLPSTRTVSPAAGRVTPVPVALTLPAMLSVYRNTVHSPQVSEVGAKDPDGVAAALTRRVGFQVAPVDLAAVGAGFRAAQVSRLLGRPVAVSVLAYRGHALSLYQMEARGVSLPPMRVMNAAGRQLLCGRGPDCHLVTWRSGGRLFVLAGNVPDGQLVMLAAAVPEAASASGTGRAS